MTKREKKKAEKKQDEPELEKSKAFTPLMRRKEADTKEIRLPARLLVVWWSGELIYSPTHCTNRIDDLPSCR